MSAVPISQRFSALGRPSIAGARDAAGYWFPLAALAIYLAYASKSGMPASDVVRALGAVALTQMLPGIMLWRCIRPRDGWLLEDLAMGFAMGIVIAVPTQTIAGYSHQRWIALVLPLLVAAILFGVPVTRARILEAQWSRLPWWLGAGIAVLSASAAPAMVNYFRHNQPRWTFGTGTPHIDTYLHLAFAGELLERGPAAWPTVIGEPLGYQWFTHAWIAQVTASSGVPLDNVLMRFLPAIMPIVAVISVAALALRLTQSSAIALGAVALASFGGQTNPFRIDGPHVLISPESPTLGMGIPTLMALIAVLAMRWRGQARRGAIVMVPVLTVVATGTKGSTTPLVIAGAALALVAMIIWQRRLALHLVADLAMMAVSLVATLVIVFNGSASGLKLGIVASAQQSSLGGRLGVNGLAQWSVLVSALTILTALGPALLGFAALVRREDRRDPVIWVLLGASIAGAFGVGLFSHPGKSQGYFLLTAMPLAGIVSAIGADRVIRELSVRTRALVFGASAVGAVGFYLIPEFVLGKLRPNSYRQLIAIVVVGLLVLLIAAVVAVALTWSTDSKRKWFIAGTTLLAAVVLCAPVSYDQYLTSSHLAKVAQGQVVSAPGVSSNGEIAAAVYIRDHSGQDDLVMTNRHCYRPQIPNHCDSRRWLVTAFTQRQSLIEGWTATNTATKLAPLRRDSATVNYWHPALLKLNDDFYKHPTKAAARKLWDMGVRWAYEENTRPHAATLEPYATLRFRDGDASAWQLKKP